MSMELNLLLQLLLLLPVLQLLVLKLLPRKTLSISY